MPYIPPPPPPRIIPPPRINPPPVFRPPPGPSIQQRQFQQQQVHRQQQQHHQQQQQFHRQQQQQQFHKQQQFQRQDEQRRFHQQQQVQRQLQADNMRQQQNQQQFLRQQEQQRQQQEHLRRQQQLHQDNLRRQNDQQRQQALLRNFHSSTEHSGPTVVHVAPNFTLEVSGALAEALTLNSDGSFEFNSAPEGLNGSTPSAPPSNPGAPPPVNPDPTSPRGPPPPYFQQTPQSPGVQSPPFQQAPPPQSPGVQSPPFHQPPPPTQAVQVADPLNRVLLNDGTQIIVKSVDEYLIIGPTGVQMVINCLPLYDPPPNALDNRPVKAGTISRDPSSERNPLRKARSEEVIESATAAGSALLSDEEDGGDPRSRSDDEQLKIVAKERQNWTRFSSTYGANYNIRLRETARSDSSLDRSTSTDREMSPPTSDIPRCQTFDDAFVTNKRKLEEKKKLSNLSSNDSHHFENDQKLKQEVANEQSHEEASKVENGIANGTTNSSEAQPHADSEKPTEETSEVKEKQQAVRMHSESTSSDTENGDSFSVNYVESTQEIPIELKRSSGSVTFLRQVSTSLSQQSSPPILEAVDSPVEANTSEPPSNVTPEEQAIQSGELSSEAVDSSAPDKPKDDENASSECDVQKVPLVLEATEVLAQSSATPSAPLSQATETTPLSPPPPSPEAKVPLSPPGTNSAAPPLESSPQAKLPLSPPPPSPFSPPTQPASQAANQKASQLPTSLPPSPLTLEPRYMERSGWLSKLSHRKGMFGDKWQKRYFVLHGCQLYYFKKYGDSTPKGVIQLLPTGWCKTVSQGTRRMSDAVATSSQEVKSSVISVALLATDGIAEAFHSQTVSVSSTENSSRTFYMIASSNEERDAWVQAIQNNILAFSHSSEALTMASKELKNILRAVSCQLPLRETPPLLYHLHARRKAVHSDQEEI